MKKGHCPPSDGDIGYTWVSLTGMVFDEKNYPALGEVNVSRTDGTGSGRSTGKDLVFSVDGGKMIGFNEDELRDILSEIGCDWAMKI